MSTLIDRELFLKKFRERFEEYCDILEQEGDDLIQEEQTFADWVGLLKDVIAQLEEEGDDDDDDVEDTPQRKAKYDDDDEDDAEDDDT